MQSCLIGLFGLLKKDFLSFGSNVHKFEGVFDQSKLNFVVKRCVSCKRWCMVDFNKLRFLFVVEHHIETDHMETHTVGVVLRLAALVLMSHEG